MHIKLYAADPLTNFIRGKLNFSPGKAAISLLLLLNIPVFVLASIYNLWGTGSFGTGLFNDYAWWGYQITGVPATLFFFFWLPDGILDVLNGLRTNKVIQTNEQTSHNDNYQSFMARFIKVYSNRAWVILALVGVTLIMWFGIIPEQRNFISWQTANNIVFWYHELFWYIAFSIGAVALLKVSITLYWFNRIFVEFKADVRVLHPDMAGGLSPLGNFSVKIGYMIGIFGFTFVMVIWSQSAYLIKNWDFSTSINPALVGFSFLYLILAPIVFFAPIGSAHSAMQKARHDFVIAISDQFEKDFSEVQRFLDKDSDELKRKLDKIEYLQKVHNMATRFPVWPFNTESLVRFFSSVFLPVVVGMIPSIIGNFIK